MSGLLLSMPVPPFVDATGKPLAGGLVYTYAAGTTTPLATYADINLTIPNANPLTLDAQGYALIYLTTANYKIDVQTSGGVSIDGFPRDNVPGSLWSGLLNANGTIAPAPNSSTFAHVIAATIQKPASGTNGELATLAIAPATFLAGASVITEAATLIITGAPSAGVTNWALDVQAGNVNVGGNLVIGGTITVGSILLVNITSAVTAALNSNADGHLITETLTTPASGTNPLLTGTRFSPPTIVSGGAAITEIDTVYISGAASAGVNNFALHVTGASQFDSALNVGGNLQAFTGILEYFRAVPLGSWTDIVFNAGNFFTNAGGSITPTAGSPYVYRYTLIGKTCILQCACKITVNNGATTDIAFQVPLAILAYAGADNQPGVPCLWSSGATAALGAVYISNTVQHVVVQRFDGTAAAVFPTADVVVKFTVTIPIQ